MAASRRDVERVERLIRVRGFEEQRKRNEWAVALRVESDAARELEERRAAVSAAQQALRDALAERTLAPVEYLDRQSAIEAALARVDLAIVRLERVRSERAVKEGEWREARRRALSLEKLRERRLESLREEASRTERRESDEVALQRHARAAAGRQAV